MGVGAGADVRLGQVPDPLVCVTDPLLPSRPRCLHRAVSQEGSQILSSGMKVPSKKVQTWVGDWTFELEVSLKQTPGTTGWKSAQLEPLCGQLRFSEPLHSHTFDLEIWCEFRDTSQPHSHTAVMGVRLAQM